MGDFKQELQENNIACFFKRKKKTIISYFIGNYMWIGIEVALSILPSCIS
jgi:hypothetical protein